MAAAAFFDVDGTLTNTNLFSALGYYILTYKNPGMALVRAAREAFRFPLLARAELLDRGAFNELLYQAYAGMTEDRLLIMADEVVDRVMVPALYTGARDLVKACQDEGLAVVFLSGSPDFLVRGLAQRMGVDPALCFGNQLEIVNTFATGRIVPPVMAGPRKAAVMRELAEKHGWKLSECHAYSNDSADAPMLSVVGRPAAVNPEMRLRAMANSQRWPVIELGR